MHVHGVTPPNAIHVTWDEMLSAPTAKAAVTVMTYEYA